jgi:hypothetical protein
VEEERVARRPAGDLVAAEAETETTVIQELTDQLAGVVAAARAASSAIYARISVVVAAVAAAAITAAVVAAAAMAVFLATTMPEAAVAEVRLILSRARCAFRVGKAGIRQRQTASSSSVGE